MSPSRQRQRLGEARILQRQILVDELLQHPDVLRYIAEQAADLAPSFPEGSPEQLGLLLLDQGARAVATMLEQAEQVQAS